jgi:hypothetical protein
MRSFASLIFDHSQPGGNQLRVLYGGPFWRSRRIGRKRKPNRRGARQSKGGIAGITPNLGKSRKAGPVASGNRRNISRAPGKVTTAMRSGI